MHEQLALLLHLVVDSCLYYEHVALPVHTFNHLRPYPFILISIYSIYSLLHLLTTSAVEVNFNENSYTVVESAGQVSVSLRIDGQFFIPVWAVVEVSEGTATGGLCMSLGLNIYEHKLVTNVLATLHAVCIHYCTIVLQISSVHSCTVFF